MKNLFLSAVVAVSFGLLPVARAVDGSPLWTNVTTVFTGSANTAGSPRAIAVDTNGNTYVTGYGINPQTNADFGTAKYGPGGVPVWARSFNGSGNGVDVASAIAVDGGGNIIVTGKSAGTGTGLDFETIKYAAATGGLTWQSRFNSSGNADDLATAIAVDASGEVCVAGQSYTTASSSSWTTLKYSSAGTLMWVNFYNGAGVGLDQAKALVTDSSGGVYVTGSVTSTNGNMDFATLKYSSSGTLLWANTFEGAAGGDDYVQGIALDANGNTFVTGFSTRPGGDFDYVTIKYASGGAGVWTNFYNGPGNSDDEAAAVAVDSTGNVYVTGTSIGAGGSSACVTIKYANNGVPVWTNFFNGVGNHGGQAAAMAVDAAGDVVVTGTSHDVVRGDQFATIKYLTTGTAVWTNLYSGGAASALAIDTGGNVYVTGGTNNYTTIEYASVLGASAVRFVTGAGDLGPVSNKFVMSLEGPLGSNAVVSATTNFQNWVPIVTNQLSPGLLQVTDTLSQGYPHRFYRAQLQ